MPFADSAAVADSLLFLDGQSALLPVEANAGFGFLPQLRPVARFVSALGSPSWC
jgi:hypothetical protein